MPAEHVSAASPTRRLRADTAEDAEVGPSPALTIGRLAGRWPPGSCSPARATSTWARRNRGWRWRSARPSGRMGRSSGSGSPASGRRRSPPGGSGPGRGGAAADGGLAAMARGDRGPAPGRPALHRLDRAAGAEGRAVHGPGLVRQPGPDRPLGLPGSRPGGRALGRSPRSTACSAKVPTSSRASGRPWPSWRAAGPPWRSWGLVVDRPGKADQRRITGTSRPARRSPIVAWSAWALSVAPAGKPLEAWASALGLPLTKGPDWTLALEVRGPGAALGAPGRAGRARVRSASRGPTSRGPRGRLAASGRRAIAGGDADPRPRPGRRACRPSPGWRSPPPPPSSVRGPRTTCRTARGGPCWRSRGRSSPW